MLELTVFVFAAFFIPKPPNPTPPISLSPIQRTHPHHSLALSAWPREASCLQVGVDRDLCHESLPGDPWHSGVPLLCMQGMLARCTPALMKGGTHSDADSRTLWKFDRQQGVDKEKAIFKRWGFSERYKSIQRTRKLTVRRFLWVFFPPSFFSFFFFLF